MWPQSQAVGQGQKFARRAALEAHMITFYGTRKNNDKTKGDKTKKNIE
jgi:hypothetical protein